MIRPLVRSLIVLWLASAAVAGGLAVYLVGLVDAAETPPTGRTLAYWDCGIDAIALPPEAGPGWLYTAAGSSGEWRYTPNINDVLSARCPDLYPAP